MKNCLLILWVCVLAGFFIFAGIDWGAPSSGRIALVMDGRTNMNSLFDSLANARKYVYKDTKSHIFSSPFHRNDELKAKSKVVIDYKKDGPTLHFSNAVRHYFLCSHDPDENNVFNALANFNPSKLDFNPRFYTYGGGYLYPLAATFKLLSSVKALHLVADMKYYFNNVDDMGGLYTAGRIFTAGMGVLGILMLVLFEYRISRSVFWAAILAVLCFISPVISGWSKIMKPHLYVLFFSVPCFIMAYRFLQTKNLKYLAAAAALCGLMTGTALNTWTFVFLPILAYFNTLGGERLNAQRVMKDMFLGSLIAAACFFAVNPYWLVSPHDVIAELKYAMSGVSNSKLELLSLYNYLKYGMGGFVSVLFCISLCAGLYLRKKAGMFNFVLLQFILATAIFIIVLSGCPSSQRYNTFLLVINFFYMAEIFRLAAARQPLIRAIVLAFIVFSVPYSLMYRSYYTNDSTDSTSTRMQAGKWINDHTGNASIGLLFDIVPHRIPPIRISEHKIAVYEHLGVLLADSAKPRYFVYSGIEKVQYFTERDMAQLHKFYKPLMEFKNSPVFMEEMSGFFNANLPIYLLERKKICPPHQTRPD